MANLFISRWKIDPAKRDQFLELFNALYTGAKELLDHEASAYHYGWSRTPNEFVAIEAWKNEATVSALRQSGAFKDLFGKMMACCSAPMEMELINDLNDDRTIFAHHPASKSTVHPDVGYGTVFI